MRDLPTAAALAELAAGDPGAAPDAVAWARGLVAREATAGDAPVVAWAARLAALLDDAAATPEALERRLAAMVRAGAHDAAPHRAAVRAHLIATVRDKLAELDPALSAGWPILAERAP